MSLKFYGKPLRHSAQIHMTRHGRAHLGCASRWLPCPGSYVRMPASTRVCNHADTNIKSTQKPLRKHCFVQVRLMLNVEDFLDFVRLAWLSMGFTVCCERPIPPSKIYVSTLPLLVLST